MPADPEPERLHSDGRLTGRLIEARLRVVYAVEGDLEHASAAAFARRLVALAEGTVGDLVLDLSGLGFLDSSGLEVLVRMHRDLGAEGRRLVLRDPSPPVSRLLELTMLDGAFELDGGAARVADGLRP